MSLVDKNLIALSDGGGAKKTNTTKQPNSRIGATGRTKTVAPGSASVAVDKTQPVAPITQNGGTYTTAAGRAIISPVTVAQNIVERAAGCSSKSGSGGSAAGCHEYTGRRFLRSVGGAACSAEGSAGRRCPAARVRGSKTHLRAIADRTRPFRRVATARSSAAGRVCAIGRGYCRTCTAHSTGRQ